MLRSRDLMSTGFRELGARAVIETAVEEIWRAMFRKHKPNDKQTSSLLAIAYKCTRNFARRKARHDSYPPKGNDRNERQSHSETPLRYEDSDREHDRGTDITKMISLCVLSVDFPGTATFFMVDTIAKSSYRPDRIV